MADDLQISGDVTVLLVEDDVLVRGMIRRMLEPASVVEANDGEHAIELVERDEAGLLDVVLTDLKMPRVSGIELIAVLHECRPDLPVVAMSGAHEPALDLDWVPLLRKPFEPTELVRTLEQMVLRSRAQHRRARQARADAAESRTLAQRRSKIARERRDKVGDLMAALLRLRSEMDKSR